LLTQPEILLVGGTLIRIFLNPDIIIGLAVSVCGAIGVIKIAF
jgi:hypothetical protein